MQNQRHNIAPRVTLQDIRSRYNGIPLSKGELDVVVSALSDCGVTDALNRLMDDSARFALDETLENI